MLSPSKASVHLHSFHLAKVDLTNGESTIGSLVLGDRQLVVCYDELDARASHSEVLLFTLCEYAVRRARAPERTAITVPARSEDLPREIVNKLPFRPARSAAIQTEN